MIPDLFEVLKNRQNIQKSIIDSRISQPSSKEIVLDEKQFEKAVQELGLEVYTADAIDQFRMNLKKAIESGKLSKAEDIEKAKRNLSGLTKVSKTDSKGRRMSYWVKTKKDEPKKDKQKEIEMRKEGFDAKRAKQLEGWDDKTLKDHLEDMIERKKDHEKEGKKFPSHLQENLDYAKYETERRSGDKKDSDISRQLKDSIKQKKERDEKTKKQFPIGKEVFHDGKKWKVDSYSPSGRISLTNGKEQKLVSPGDIEKAEKETPEQKKIAKVMKEFKDGILETPDGERVTNKKQAMAIAISESKNLSKSDISEALTVLGLDLEK